MKQRTIHFFLAVFFLLLGNVAKAQEVTSALNDVEIKLTADNIASTETMKTAINEAISKLESDKQSNINLKFTLDCITVDQVNFGNLKEAIKSNNNVKGIDYSSITDLKTLPNEGLRELSNVTTIKLPALTSLSNNLFTGCGNLVNLTIGEWNNTENNEGLSMATIPDGCFQTCGSLKNLYFKDVKEIGGWAFSGCASITEFPIKSLATDAKVEIKNNAFEAMGFTTLSLPEGITAIADNSFANCKSLTSITFPKSLASLRPSFDTGCEKLKVVAFAEGNDKYVSNGDFVYEKNGEELTLSKVLFTSNDVTIPSTVDGKKVTAIGGSAFQNTQVTSIKFDEDSNIKTIGSWAFSGCKSLTSIKLPSSVTEIGEKAFEICDGLTTVTLNEGLKTIGTAAFYNSNNANFTTLNIPASVESIAADFINGCSNIKTLTVAEGNQHFVAENGIMYSNRIKNNDNTFIENTYNIFRVPEAYEVTSTSKETIFTKVNENGKEELKNVTKEFKSLNLTNQDKITINGTEGTITYVGSNAFANCKNIEVLKVPNTVTNLQDECCKSSAITVFYIPENLTATGYGSGTPFSLCNNLTAFAGDNEKLQNFYVDDRGILYNRDRNDFRLYKVPNNYYTTTNGIFTVRYYVKSIQTCAFEGVQNINTVILAQGIKAVSHRCFYNAGANLTKVLIPNSVTSIGQDVFAGSNIKDVIMLTTTETAPGNGNNNASYNCFWNWNTGGKIHLSSGYGDDIANNWIAASENAGVGTDSYQYGWRMLNAEGRLDYTIKHRAIFEKSTDITGFNGADETSILNEKDSKNTLDGNTHYDYITLYRSFSSLKKDKDSDPDKYASLALPVDVTKATLVNAFGADTKVWEFVGRKNTIINFEKVNLADKNDDDIIIKKGVGVLISPEYKEDSYLLQMNLGTPATQKAENGSQMVMAANSVNAESDENAVTIGTDNAATSFGASYFDEIKTTTGNYAFDANNQKIENQEFKHGCYGTFQAKASMPAGSYYMTSEGGFKYAVNSQKISKAFRAFIHGNETESNTQKASAKISIDGFTTNIADVNIEGFEPQSGNIYNINGQLVRKNATSTDGLSKGIYIMNGKKIIVK